MYDDFEKGIRVLLEVLADKGNTSKLIDGLSITVAKLTNAGFILTTEPMRKLLVVFKLLKTLYEADDKRRFLTIAVQVYREDRKLFVYICCLGTHTFTWKGPCRSSTMTLRRSTVELTFTVLRS